MNKSVRILVLGTASVTLAAVSACADMSELIEDSSAGLNGGFEVVESGLPVNWLVYTPTTIPTGDYDLVIDTEEQHSGDQSLKFVVRECSSDGGWHSPGFSRQFEATPGATYTVAFWARNDGAEFHARIGGVSAKEGEYETIVRSTESLGEWTRFEHVYTLSADYDQLRFELSILQPGTFWIDDVTISGLE